LRACPKDDDPSGSTNAGNAADAAEAGATEEKRTDDFVPKGYCPDLVEAIEQTMTRNGTEVTWEDIAGLEGPKELFKQTIVLPALMPEFFKVNYELDILPHPQFLSMRSIPLEVNVDKQMNMKLVGDEALRRRFEQRIYIPLPDKPARLSLLCSSLKEVRIADDVDLETFAEQLEGYSGADITNVCRKAALMGVKRLTRMMSPAEIAKLSREEVDLPITWQDLQEAFNDTNPSVSDENIRQYIEWMEKYGST
ncbi:hypothetical protein TELCIR_14826, partial [Teladorsagia circumcincta]